MKKYLLVVLSLAFVLTTWAQQTITGKVTDGETGESVPGANVIEKGTSNGTTTDFDGNFRLTVSDDAVLVISFVGYKQQEVSVGSRSVVDVSLDLDVAQLAEVVVIGYGTQEKKDATGAVASVKAEDFNQGVIASPEQLIQGRTAGVQITASSGEPGAGLNIRIRGTSSVRNGNNPLFVVDGVPLSGGDVSAGISDQARGSGPSRNPLNFLNPNDIASIDILKDASATAIYGSRGANGVVLITTKGGKGASSRLDYSGTYSIASAARTYDLLERDAFLSGARALGADPIDEGANTDWQDEVFRTSTSTNHSLSYSNGYETGDYRVSLGYNWQEGIIKNTSLERYTARVNWNQDFLDDKLHLGVQGTFSWVNDEATLITDNAGFQGDLLGTVYSANPTWPASNFQPTGSIASPWAILEFYEDETETNRSLINVSLDYDITDDLNFKINTGFDNSNSERNTAFSSDLQIGNGGIQDQGRASLGDLETSSNLLEAFFNYDAEVGPGRLNAVVGYSYQEFNREGSNFLGWGFDDNQYLNYADITRAGVSQVASRSGGNWQVIGSSPQNRYIGAITSNGILSQTGLAPVAIEGVTAVTAEKFAETDELQSYFGRLNYSLMDKYLITGTVRVDGSTRFGTDNRYGVFPSGAVGWRISEEAFAPSFFSDLKLRAGFGITGNQEIPHNVHQARDRFNAPTINNDGTTNFNGTNRPAFNNADLKWEETTQINVGIDWAILDGRLNGVIDFYNKTTTDLLIQQVSAQPAPQPFTWTNLDADVVNSGVEFSFNFVAVDQTDFGFDISFNIAFNNNEVKNFAGSLDTGQINGQGLTGAFAQRIADGQPLYAFFLRQFGGFNAEGQSIYPNGDVQVFTGESPLPTTNTGLTLNFRYQDFSLSTFLTGQFGHYIYNNTENALFTAGSLAQGRNVIADVVGNGEATSNAPDVSTRFIEKGDFIRFQNFTAGYTFNTEGTFISSLKLFLTGQNLFLITSYEGTDPEVDTNKALNQIPSAGIEYTAYPRARTFTIGINASF